MGQSAAWKASLSPFPAYYMSTHVAKTESARHFGEAVKQNINEMRWEFHPQ